MAKVVFVLIDGLGDVNSSNLNNLTPLQFLNIPTFDSISNAGINGLMDPVEPGLACGSDTAHLSILEYDPRIYYRGRGAFETMGTGVHMNPGDIAFKSNFATLNETNTENQKIKTENRIVVKRRADRHFEELGPVLCDLLNGLKLPSFPDYQVVVKYATEHRCGVLVRGPSLTDAISGTDPLKDNLPLLKSKPLDDTPEAKLTSEIVNELSEQIHLILSVHPINEDRKKRGKSPADVVLLRGCGSRIHVPSFYEKHGMKPFFIAPTAIIAGLAMSLDIDIVKSSGGTGDYFTNFDSKAEALLKSLTETDSEKTYDFGFLHIKAVDDCGHDRNLKLKNYFLGQIDVMLSKIILNLQHNTKQTGQQYIIAVTGDHSTPVEFGEHSHEPVPFACAFIEDVNIDGTATSKEFRRDSVKEFSEIAARDGILGRFPGSEVMSIIKKYRTLNQSSS